MQLMVVARPSTVVFAALYSLPTEPAAIAVYLLLAGSFWLVWMGNRNPDGKRTDGPAAASETSPEAESDVAVEGDGTEAGRHDAVVGRVSKKRKLSRAERRRRGHIDWIQ